MEARLRPVNALLALIMRGDLTPPVLADAGFRIAGLEIPVGLPGARVVVDVLLVHDATSHLLACEAKSGANVEDAQARRYAALDAQQVVQAGAVNLPSRIAPTVEAVFVCLADHTVRIRTGLDRAEVQAAVLAVGPGRVSLDNPDAAGEVLAAALVVPAKLPAGVPRLIAFDQDSPVGVVRPAVRAVLVAHLSRRSFEASSATIAEETARFLATYGGTARGRFIRNVEEALREIATDEPNQFLYQRRTGNRGATVRFLRTPEDNDTRGRTQAYQALARPAHTPHGPRFIDDPDQLDLLDLLSELDHAEDVGGDRDDEGSEEEKP